MRKQYQAKVFDTGQHDNIIRDGVLTTRQAYDMFLKAGLNTKEWLQKTYANIKQPTIEEMKDIEGVVDKYQDKTDIQDTINTLKTKINNAEEGLKQLKNENSILEQKIKEINTQSVDTTEKKD